jgi:hypothetical protein
MAAHKTTTAPVTRHRVRRAARPLHPLVRPDTGQATKLVIRLNSLLAPDGWELRASGFISGRPVYAASRPRAARDG